MKTILLIGLGGFGGHIAMKLAEMDNVQVMGVDENEETVNEMLPYLTNAQIGDSTNVAFLESLGVNNFDVCIVAIGGDFQNSLETTSNLKELGARTVVSTASRDIQAKFLLRNGADDVLFPEKQLAKWAAIRYGAEHVLDYIELDENNTIVEVTIPEGWAGKSVGQLDIRKKYNINILAIKQDGRINASVSPDTVLRDSETLLVLGEYKTLQKCFKI